MHLISHRKANGHHLVNALKFLWRSWLPLTNASRHTGLWCELSSLWAAITAPLLEPLKRLRCFDFQVLNDVIPHCALDSLRPRLEEDVLRQLLSYKEVGSSRLCCTWTADMKTPGHYGTLCPKHHPHLRPEIHANPTVESVVEHLLGGPGFFMISAGGNCALPGSGYQALHSDGSHIWKSEAEAKATGESWPHRCRFVVANFGIDDITEEMGATEVWPGSVSCYGSHLST
eukprot:SAG31_NODE_49_length_30599_cov_15.615016_16_plen_230_part_00